MGFAALYPSYIPSWPGLYRPSTSWLRKGSAWMPGTSPGMTEERDASVAYLPSHFGGRFSANAFGPSM
jgi:hypothetical protein